LDRSETVKVAHILPEAYAQFMHRTSYHLVTAPMITGTNPGLAAMFRVLHNRGDFVIMDNGAAEVAAHEAAPTNFEEVVRLADLIGADEICMPDVLRDRRATLALIESTKAPNLVPPTRRMFIPQGNSPQEWLAGFRDLLKRWKCVSIGIPKHLERFGDGTHSGRWLICAALQQGRAYKYWNFHLLGCYDNPLKEFKPIAKDFPWVRGMDSGVAAAYAQANLGLRQYPGGHVQLRWNELLDDRLLEQNMDVLTDWAQGRD
jgi:hypothetical protein